MKAKISCILTEKKSRYCISTYLDTDTESNFFFLDFLRVLSLFQTNTCYADSGTFLLLPLLQLVAPQPFQNNFPITDIATF